MKIYYAVLLFILGSCLASFYGVVGKRLLKGESIVRPKSHCDNCSHPLSIFDLIPVLSFFILKGKCKYCSSKLDITEPLIELFTGVTFAFFYLYFGISYNFFMSLILISLLDLIFITDFKNMIILDSPLIISSILIFILKIYYYDLSYALNGVISGLILFFFMLLVGFIGKLIFKREALGGGDIKLSFVMGLTLALPLGFISLILSTFLALPYATFSLFSTKEREVPFGPFLIASLLIVFFFSDKFMNILYLFYM